MADSRTFGRFGWDATSNSLVTTGVTCGRFESITGGFQLAEFQCDSCQPRFGTRAGLFFDNLVGRRKSRSLFARRSNMASSSAGSLDNNKDRVDATSVSVSMQ